MRKFYKSKVTNKTPEYELSEEEKNKDFKLKCVELAFDIIDQIKDI